MKPLFLNYCVVAAVILVLFIVGISCKKSKDENALPQPNRAPLANAGSNQFISLPKNYVTLDGSWSTDRENNITKTEWRKVSGPSSFKISNAALLTTTVSELIEGDYAFELRITDSHGLISIDTMTVTVLACFKEFDLDETISCNYVFNDNAEDCGDYPYSPCIYSDVVSITGWVSVDSIGLLEFSVYEQTDTALSDHILVTSAGISQVDQSLYRRYLSGPVSAMNFVELIKKGGGVFNGTFEAFHASAFDCDPNLSNNYPPLSISGTIDTSTRRVNLRITGKVFL